MSVANVSPFRVVCHCHVHTGKGATNTDKDSPTVTDICTVDITLFSFQCSLYGPRASLSLCVHVALYKCLNSVMLRADRCVTAMLYSRVPTRAICVRSYATVPVQPPLRGLNSAVREKAEKLSRDWKGTSSSGEYTKNFIAGEFVQSRATQWIDVVDPVRRIYHSPLILIQVHGVIVHANTPHPCSGNNQ